MIHSFIHCQLLGTSLLNYNLIIIMNRRPMCSVLVFSLAYQLATFFTQLTQSLLPQLPNPFLRQLRHQPYQHQLHHTIHQMAITIPITKYIQNILYLPSPLLPAVAEEHTLDAIRDQIQDALGTGRADLELFGWRGHRTRRSEGVIWKDSRASGV